ETLAAACSLQKVRANASKRVAFVTDEILGVTKNAGAATANTFLSLKLADLGYVVEVRFAAPLGAEGVRQPWRREYYRRGIEVKAIEPHAELVSPETFAMPCAVEKAIRQAPPDVVICDDRYGSCYITVRLRSLGLDFEQTLFVVYCHGTTAWI